MKKISIIAIITVLLLSIDANACSCVVVNESQKKKITRFFDKSDTIFIGTVTAVEELNKGKRQSSGDPVRYTFQVTEWFKGKSSKKQIEIITAISEISCGYNFKIGNSYIVHSLRSDYFGDRFPEYMDEKEVNTSGLCYGNKIKEDLNRKSLRFYKRLSKI